MDGPRVGSDEILQVQVSLTRDGDQLIFDYAGSSPQVDAAVNCTYIACVAGTTVPLYSFLCQGDIDWNDGLRRCVTVNAPEGSVVNATFPAAVSISTVGFRWLATVAATQAVAKMFNSSERFRDRVCPSWNSSANCNNLFGVTANGKRVGALLSDHRSAGGAARSFGDGFSRAGTITSYAASLGNVESQEWKLPLLYLFRRQLTDSGGPGKYRGGLSACAAVTPYGTDQLVFKSTNTAGTDQSNAHGPEGGYPGAGSQAMVAAASGLADAFARRDPPDSVGWFTDMRYMPSKSDDMLDPDDVFLFFPTGGGYGDALERDGEAVRADVESGRVSLQRAGQIYGIVLAADGTLDQPATEAKRTEIRGRRKQDPPGPWTPDDTSAVDDGKVRCRTCQTVLTGAGNAIVTRVPLAKAGPWLAMRWGGHSPNFALEEVSCPSCATLIAVREVRTED